MDFFKKLLMVKKFLLRPTADFNRLPEKKRMMNDKRNKLTGEMIFESFSFKIICYFNNNFFMVMIVIVIADNPV